MKLRLLGRFTGAHQRPVSFCHLEMNLADSDVMRAFRTSLLNRGTLSEIVEVRLRKGLHQSGPNATPVIILDA